MISYCYFRLGNYQKAYESARGGLHYGFNLELTVNRGLAAAGLGRSEEAVDLLRTAAETGIRHDEVIYCQARMYSLLHDVNNAILYLKEAIKENKKNKEEARTEKDFEVISSTAEFKELILT